MGIDLGKVIGQLRVGGRIVEVGMLIGYGRDKTVPVRIGGRTPAGKSLDPVAETIPQDLITAFHAVQRMKRKLWGQSLIEVKVEQGGNQLPPRQISSAAEDHQNRWPMMRIVCHG